jgi:hypothetical protein
MISGFKQFVLRGNVVDMAVGVVAGSAFAAVVAALTKDLLTPLIAALVGKPDFAAIRFTVNGSVFALGDFINALFGLGIAQRVLRDGITRRHACGNITCLIFVSHVLPACKPLSEDENPHSPR